MKTFSPPPDSGVKTARNGHRHRGMTGRFLVLCAVFALGPLHASAADTLRVVTHRDVTVVTDPSAGFRSYRAWGVFPSPDLPVRRVVLRVKFGCPDSIRCADWDYLDHVMIRRKGGASGAPLDVEIGRMLTPYGGAFDENWNFEWTTDVTDFASLLRDSVEIEYYHSGYEPNTDRGWRITVEFDILPGPPVVSVHSLRSIYDGKYPYGDSAKPIAEALLPVTFTVSDSADHVRFIVYQTGHGGDENGCGEFCDKYREVLFDGSVADRRRIWKQCGDNPLSPQAGTWIFDRANWCPGDLVEPDVYDFAVEPGSTHSIGIRMEPYSYPGTNAQESIRAYLLEYRGPSARNDAAIDRVIVPSDDDEGGRLNPSCLGAVVMIRNLGAAPLEKLYIRYGTLAFEDRSFVWEGHIPFNAVARIGLPGEIRSRKGRNIYKVAILSVNGAEDAYVGDNVMRVAYEGVPSHLSPLVFRLKTNAEASQNSYVLRSADGDVVDARAPGSLRPDTTYLDTFRLDPGCYELTLNDSAGDGLEFWYNTRGGRGTARLLDAGGVMLKNFESDFGSVARYGFRVTLNQRLVAAPAADPAIGLFPTMTLGVTTMDYFGNTAAAVVAKIVTDPGGETVEERRFDNFRDGEVRFDLTSRGPQRYYLKVFVDGVMKFNKRIRVVERID